MARRASNEEVDSLRQEQRDEVESTMVGAGNVGPFTKGMSRGVAVWVPIGTIVGALIGLALAPLVMEDGVILMVIIGAVAGATFGFSVGGFVGSRRRGEGDARLDDPSTVRRETSPTPGETTTTATGGGAPAAPSSEEARKLIKE
jgi:hypothetical protein